MREVVVLSGKGGTGKTSLVAGLVELIRSERDVPIRAGFADVDVDAANLELVFSACLIQEEIFLGGSVAGIDSDLCLGCGRCREVCRFDAVVNENGSFRVEALLCEGCGACVYQCPEQAVHFQPQLAGKWMRSTLGGQELFHADLLPGRENSGKLVARVREQAREYALNQGLDLLLVDGPPGTGCPVHSAVTGADLVLIVTEPTAAGLQDLERVLGTAAHFDVPSQVCLNKVDQFPEGAEQITTFCRSRGVEVIGRIPFDRRVPEAMVQGTNVIAYAPESGAARAIAVIWGEIKGLFKMEGPLEDSEQVEPGAADGVPSG